MTWKCEMLLEFVQREGRVPSAKETVQGFKIGVFWDSVKQRESCKKQYESLLSKNELLRQDYERLQDAKEEKKGKTSLTLIEKSELLLEFVQREGRVPSAKDTVQGFKIGQFWNHTKQGQKVKQYQTLLSKNELLRQDYERLQDAKEEKKRKTSLTPNEKLELLLEFVQREGRVPSRKETVQGFKMGILWDSVKQGRCKEQCESLLSKNELLRQDYERLQGVKEKKKEKTPLPPIKKSELLLEFVQREGRIPLQKEICEGFKMGKFWNSVKQGQCCKKQYESLLSKNELLRKAYDRIQLLKQQKQKESD